MLSIFSRIKNKIRGIITKNRIHKRLRNYQVILGQDNMSQQYDNTTNSNDTSETIVYDIPTNASPPLPPSPACPTRRLFHTEIETTIIQNDYEMQELLQRIDQFHIDVSNVTLERRFESMLNNLPNVSDIEKIKIKLLYIIIANDMYRPIFEEKKQYRSIKINQYIGVFRYNNYIIRIDDSPYSFMNEEAVMLSTSGFNGSNIIRPFLLYMNIRHNYITNDTCECRKPNCHCVYIDNADSEFDSVSNTTETSNVSQQCFDKLRKNTVSFSIQYYVKDTTSLYLWVKDNLASDIYNRFSSIQRTFFIHLFHQCALLLRDIHRVGVVHGDIKPDNILIREHLNFNINHPERCKNFTVYLIDFGLSGPHKKGLGTGGTIPYCHPEFKNITDTTRSSKYNWKPLDMKHDVWSLGITFLTMYIYRDFYSYYHKYPNYFFLKDGYVSSIVIDVITDSAINDLFTKMMTADCIPIEDVCHLLQNMQSPLG